MSRAPRFAVTVLFAFLLFAFAREAVAQDLGVTSAPPVVVKTFPEAGASGVDPKVSEIRVTFSKEMIDGSWSWVVDSKATFPKLTGRPRFERDGRTCVLPVALAAGRSYVLWLNSSKQVGFKDREGRAALPYLLSFETRKVTQARRRAPRR